MHRDPTGAPLDPATVQRRLDLFKVRCAELGLAVTHQRLVIYQALISGFLHPTPEEVYESVRRQIPTLSFGTVYKNIRTFAEAGLIREVNLLHEKLRLDANLEDHYHLICTRCKAVSDLPASALPPVAVPGALPRGFRAERVNIEILGLCASCAAREA